MLLKPDMRVDKITDITIEMLKSNNIKAVILDSDNTLIDLNKNPLDGIKEWINEMKKNGIKFCILSNSIKKKKVEKVSKMLDIPYVFFSIKPTKFGFRKAKKILNLNVEQIGVVGDQILTDVIGANRMGMFSILVKPIEEKDIWITRIKRPLENKIIKNYIQNKKK